MKKSIAIFIISVVITGWIGSSFSPNIVFAAQEGILENEGNDQADIPEDNEHLDNSAEDEDGDSSNESAEDEETAFQKIEIEENNGLPVVNEPADISEDNEDNEQPDKAAEDEKGNSVNEPVEDEEPILQGTEIEKNNGILPRDESDRNEENLFGYGMEDDEQEPIQNEKKDLAEKTEKNSSEKETKTSLQIPEKLDITIDPFEINGRGQIYSKEYCIKNSGETAGLLRITNFMCTPGENSGVVITNNNNGIHNANEKLVYMEIVFGNGYRITFPSEEAEYEIHLEPGEELRFFYRGEVNENALQGWKEHDLMVGMVYFWNIEKEVPENEADLKEKEIPVIDSENVENTAKEDDLRAVWRDEDMPGISESKDSDDISESNNLEGNVDEKNINGEEKLKSGEKDFQESQDDLADRNKN